jgi:hypothetical protein
MADNEHDLSETIGVLRAQRDILDEELEDIRKIVNDNEAITQAQFKSLEKTVNEIRDNARDVMHIAVGVDGRNGLRGSIDTLSANVNNVIRDFEFLKNAANNYNETKSVLLKMFATSAIAVIFQLMAGVWYIATEHNKQQTMREDLNRVIAYIERVRGLSDARELKPDIFRKDENRKAESQ